MTNIEDRVWAKEVLGNNYVIKYEPSASVFHYHGINQDRDYNRCSNVVNILENLFENYPDEKIKKDYVSLNDLNICAIIPFRGKTFNIKGKNILEYTIEKIKYSKLINKIIVSTDNIDTKKEAKKFGAECPSIRPKILSQSISDIVTVANHTLDEYQKKGQKFNWSFVNL